MGAAVFKSFKVRSRFNGIVYSLLLFYDDKSKSIIIIEISNRDNYENKNNILISLYFSL